jgi:hypothetical protein
VATDPEVGEVPPGAPGNSWGRHRALTRSQTSAGAWQMRHVGGGGGVPVATDLPNLNGYTDGAVRLLEDDFGRLVLLFGSSSAAFAVPTSSAGGFALGVPVDFTGAMVSGGRSLAGPFYVAASRGGTPPGRDVDFLLDTVSGGAPELFYGRIGLY